MARGFFVTFEGIDGTGKTTQVNLVNQELLATGVLTLVTKEPGDDVVIGGLRVTVGSNIGRQIRQMLFFDPSTKNMAPGVADCLFLADHIQVTERDIKPALREGKVVLCDRYADSQFAYTKSGTKKCPRWALKAYLENYKLTPDLTVLLTGDPLLLAARCKSRAGTEGDKQAGKVWDGVTLQQLVQDAYLLQLGGLKRTFVLDVTDKTIEESHNMIMRELVLRMEQHKRAKKQEQLELPIVEDLLAEGEEQWDEHPPSAAGH